MSIVCVPFDPLAFCKLKSTFHFPPVLLSAAFWKPFSSTTSALVVEYIKLITKLYEPDNAWVPAMAEPNIPSFA